MIFKKLATDIKDLDEAKGVIDAYANVYNVMDSDGDISMPGSFTKTVKENAKRIRVLKDHNPTVMLGVPLEIDPKDAYGLRTLSQFNLNKDVGRDMFSDIMLMQQTGMSAELSIGFGATIRDPKDQRKIKEYTWLGEYSFLSSWAANHLSTVNDIKSIKSHYGIMELLSKAYDLPYSDIRLKNIEAILKSLDEVPGKDTTPAAEPIIEALQQANTILELKNFLANE